MSNNPEDKALQLYGEAFKRFCSTLPNSKAHLQAKEMALWKARGILNETLLHDHTVFDHERTGHWLEIIDELEKL